MAEKSESVREQDSWVQPQVTLEERRLCWKPPALRWATSVTNYLGLYRKPRDMKVITAK